MLTTDALMWHDIFPSKRSGLDIWAFRSNELLPTQEVLLAGGWIHADPVSTCPCCDQLSADTMLLECYFKHNIRSVNKLEARKKHHSFSTGCSGKHCSLRGLSSKFTLSSLICSFFLHVCFYMIYQIAKLTLMLVWC